MIFSCRAPLLRLALLSFFLANAFAAAADDLQLSVSGDSVVLTYTNTSDIFTQLEGSADLSNWTALDLAQAISANDDGSETITSSVARDSEGVSFFRLERWPARYVTLAWDPAPDPSVVGYALLVSKESDGSTRRIDTGAATSSTVAVPDDGTLYGFIVVSYNADGIDSIPSNDLELDL